ncbi:hypothetical protein [Sneathiella sp.]|jgi:hypothetical protein|uniref:hypothetical protein n=1 Tax=Sneathiella sp. TaxID=1964365 RepID=UPI0039E2B43D
MSRHERLSFTLCQHYQNKYGPDVLERLEQDASFCETQNDLRRRNLLLRVRDQILLEEAAISP